MTGAKVFTELIKKMKRMAMSDKMLDSKNAVVETCCTRLWLSSVKCDMGSKKEEKYIGGKVLGKLQWSNFAPTLIVLTALLF